jgi:hypothetical protein
MIAALATLAFLATLWLLVVAGAAILEESGPKIAAALKGQSAIDEPKQVARRLRVRSSFRQPMRAQPRLRAAA